MPDKYDPRGVGEENRKRVFEFFQQNPCHRNRDAAEELGLSVMAVGRHAKAIREGWRPGPKMSLDEAIEHLTTPCPFIQDLAFKAQNDG